VMELRGILAMEYLVNRHVRPPEADTALDIILDALREITGQLDVLDGLPGSCAGRSVDQLSLVVPVHRLGKSIIEAVPDAADRGHRPCSG
jgi:hypothetical protein